MIKTHFKLIAVIFSILALTSCMTGSLTESTLPQTGSSGKLKAEYIDGSAVLKKENDYKRHLTRGYYSADDTVRVLLITEPYLKAVSRQWAQKDGEKNSATPEQIQQSQDYMNQKNIKELVLDKTCFDIEVNSNSEAAGNSDFWKAIVTEAKSRKEEMLTVKFSLNYIQRDRGGWFQFHGVLCTPERLNVKNGISMILTPLYRENKTILLKWER